MILFPCAKINIGLNVIERMHNGFHALETMMLPIPLYDVLEILPSEKFEWKQTGRTISGESSDNLCVKAFRLIQERYNIGQVYMHLHKRIPFGAGLGGGSSDASFVIKGLNDLFSLNLTLDEQRNLVAELGSDCAFFVDTVPQIATGQGDILRSVKIDLSNCSLILIKPPIFVSTAHAYSTVHISGDRERLQKDIQRPIEEWKYCVKNDFEISIFKQYPQLAGIKSRLYEQGAQYASMSGSGSAIYGIFRGKVPEISIDNCETFYLKME